MSNRRQFLQSLAAPAAFPMIVKASALGRGGAVPPNSRVNLATIGCGNMGNGHLSNFLKIAECKVVAVCDLDEAHLTDARDKVNKAYASKDCATYHAFEEVIYRRDIDAVSMACPDHWHGLVATAALKAGKDVYGEKPLAHNFHEGMEIVAAVKKNNRIWQTGSWQRSKPQFHQACELVRNGRIGKVTRVEVGLPDGPFDYARMKGNVAISDPPANLYYDRWLGPAPEAPYSAARVHQNWRWNLDYGGGQLMDWIGHHCDIAHWGMGWDETGPYEVSGVGEYPSRTELWNSARRYRISLKYAGGVEMIIAGGHKDITSGTKWIGDKGWIWVDRSGIKAEPAGILQSTIGPDEIHLTKSADHYRQFIECVKSRQETITPARIAHRSATPGWLGQIAMLTGRKISWDAEQQKILYDDTAAKLLRRDMRKPYNL